MNDFSRLIYGEGLFGGLSSNSLALQQQAVQFPGQERRPAIEVARYRLTAARSEVERLEKVIALLEKMPEVDELLELMAGRSRTGLEGK